MNYFADTAGWLIKLATTQVPSRFVIAFFLSFILGMTILTVSLVGSGVFSFPAPS